MMIFLENRIIKKANNNVLNNSNQVNLSMKII
jgi:hypothetical protein